MKQAKTSLLLSLILTVNLGVVAIAARFSPITTRGMNVFSRGVVQSWGGVVLQGTTEFYDNSKREISPRSLKLQLDAQPDKSEQICIVYQTTCYEIGISSQNAIPLATWVFTGQTGAFTAFRPQEGEEVQLRNVGWGFAPAELAQGTIPQILSFIDRPATGIVLEPFDDSEMIRKKYNQRLGSNFAPAPDRLEDDSYIMTDTDTKYTAKLVNKQVELTGLIKMYEWQLYQGVEYPYITKVRRACIPASIKATDNKDCSLVGKGTPQQIEQLYQAQKEALLLTQTTAVFRAFADDNCEELSRFVKANNKSYNFPANQCEKLRELAKEAQSN